VGKTTVIRCLLAAEGFVCLEWNASDCRSARALEPVMRAMTQRTRTLRPRQADAPWCWADTRYCVVLEELDGFQGTEDSGGFALLQQMAPHARRPVLCTANDLGGKALSSLCKRAQLVSHVKFWPCRPEAIERCLQRVQHTARAQQEVDGRRRRRRRWLRPHQLRHIAAVANGDLRYAIGQLQLACETSRPRATGVLAAAEEEPPDTWAATAAPNDDDDDAADVDYGPQHKDPGSKSVFQVAERLFLRHSDDLTYPLTAAMDDALLDFPLMPAFVACNGARLAEHFAAGRPLDQQAGVDMCAELLARSAAADCMHQTLMRHQDYALMPYIGAVGGVGAAVQLAAAAAAPRCGGVGGGHTWQQQQQPTRLPTRVLTFPDVLGKTSSGNKVAARLRTLGHGGAAAGEAIPQEGGRPAAPTGLPLPSAHLPTAIETEDLVTHLRLLVAGAQYDAAAKLAAAYGIGTFTDVADLAKSLEFTSSANVFTAAVVRKCNTALAKATAAAATTTTASHDTSGEAHTAWTRTVPVPLPLPPPPPPPKTPAAVYVYCPEPPLLPQSAAQAEWQQSMPMDAVRLRMGGGGCVRPGNHSQPDAVARGPSNPPPPPPPPPSTQVPAAAAAPKQDRRRRRGAEPVSKIPAAKKPTAAPTAGRNALLTNWLVMKPPPVVDPQQQQQEKKQIGRQ